MASGWPPRIFEKFVQLGLVQVAAVEGLPHQCQIVAWPAGSVLGTVLLADALGKPDTAGEPKGLGEELGDAPPLSLGELQDVSSWAAALTKRLDRRFPVPRRSPLMSQAGCA